MTVRYEEAQGKLHEVLRELLPHEIADDVFFYDAAFIALVSRSYLTADDTTKRDIRDFHAIDGVRMLHERVKHTKDGTPTSDDLLSWFDGLREDEEA